jgi:small basic protein
MICHIFIFLLQMGARLGRGLPTAVVIEFAIRTFQRFKKILNLLLCRWVDIGGKRIARRCD